MKHYALIYILHCPSISFLWSWQYYGVNKEKQKSRLPVKINKRIIGVRKEREKIITFLNQNGYVLKDENIIFNSNLQNIIEKINLISKVINTETKMNFKNIN